MLLIDAFVELLQSTISGCSDFAGQQYDDKSAPVTVNRHVEPIQFRSLPNWVVRRSGIGRLKTSTFAPWCSGLYPLGSLRTSLNSSLSNLQTHQRVRTMHTMH